MMIPWMSAVVAPPKVCPSIISILVTGATAGFGESITRRFIANGHKVIATGRREERLKTLKDELGENLYTAQLDVRNRAAIEELIA